MPKPLAMQLKLAKRLDSGDIFANDVKFEVNDSSHFYLMKVGVVISLSLIHI